MLEDSEYAPWFADKQLYMDPQHGYYYFVGDRAYLVKNQVWAMATAEGKQTGNRTPLPHDQVLDIVRHNCSPDIRQYCERLLAARNPSN